MYQERKLKLYIKCLLKNLHTIITDFNDYLLAIFALEL